MPNSNRFIVRDSVDESLPSLIEEDYDPASPFFPPLEYSDAEITRESFEAMPMSIQLPPFDLPKWGMEERYIVADIWQKQMSYRLKWIFYREEREGVNRSRFIAPFSPADFKQKVSKLTEPHPMNTVTSSFYDWKIGGADFIMRLESFRSQDAEYLRCHFIYRPNGKELCYQDRVWDGQVFELINMTWAET